MRKSKYITTFVAATHLTCLSGCSVPTPIPPSVPAVQYSQNLKSQLAEQQQLRGQPRAMLRYASDELPPEAAHAAAAPQGGTGSYYEYHSQQPNIRDYTGPLSLGDPGVSASLWQETRGQNEIFRDDRAWQPMDLITIIVLENSEGSKEADTEVKSESTISAALENLLGFEDDIVDSNNNVKLDSLISASATNDYKGEGETTRKGKLKASISAMVAEVLPSGILRIEGEKIIAVNSEEQIMKISGLVRPRDVNSRNEVDSAKIANMRIDYYGSGQVGDYQSAGWGSRIIKKLWPF